MKGFVAGILIAGFATAWALCERMDRLEAKRDFAESQAFCESLRKDKASIEEGNERVCKRWAEMYQEASDRAAMWLKKYNDLRRQHPEPMS